MYNLTWRNKFLTINAKTIDDMIEMLQCAAADLSMMKDDGITLQDGAEDDYAQLVTSDPEVAKRWNFEEEICEEA